MTLVMAYVILIAAGIAATTMVLESLVRGRGFATRWVWVAALGLTTLTTVFALVVPRGAQVLELAPAEASVTTRAPIGIAAPANAWLDVDQLLASANVALPVAWLMASALLLVALGAGQQRYRRMRARARTARVGGHDVLLTEDVGPAVAGVRRPVVLVPRWVLALDEGSQQLLLSHELEHVRQRDTWLLLFGAVSVALTPWNPVVWWMVKRLRLAVEQDCDARVLARHPGVRRYADLLLTAASRHDLASRFLAAHFGEYTSDLVRRIEAMTNTRRVSWRKAGAAAFVAATLIAIACETPRPDPVAPLKSGDADPISSADANEEIVKARLLSDSRTPKYPELLRQAGVEGEALVSFVIDETGTPDVATFKVIRSTHELFAAAVRAALPGMRFVPAEANGKKVRQVVSEPFTFTLAGAVKQKISGDPSTVQITGVEPKKLAYTVRKADLADKTGAMERVEVARRRLVEKAAGSPSVGGRSARQGTTPQIILRGSGNAIGSPLVIVDGVVMTGKLDDIDPATIQSIEVVKGAAASLTYGDRAKDGVIQITTKARKRIP